MTADLTGALLAALLKDAATKEVKNIHQDTWTIEESESSQDGYRNQLTGSIYRMGTKTMGDVTFNWTIGQYDYATKVEFLGGVAGIGIVGTAMEPENDAVSSEYWFDSSEVVTA